MYRGPPLSVALTKIRPDAAAQTMLLEPAMQHIGIHAMFTRGCGNRCAGLQARGISSALNYGA